MMRETQTGYAGPSKKRATNVSLRESLLDEARRLGVNISQACEQGLEARVKEERARQWLEANRDALESSNEFVAKHGLPLRRHRKF